MSDTGQNGPSGHCLSDAIKARVLDLFLQPDRDTNYAEALIDQVELEIASAMQFSWSEGWRGGEIHSRRQQQEAT